MRQESPEKHPEWTVSSDVLYAKVSVRKKETSIRQRAITVMMHDSSRAPVITNTYTAPTEEAQRLEIRKPQLRAGEGNRIALQIQAGSTDFWGARMPTKRGSANTGSDVTFEKRSPATRKQRIISIRSVRRESPESIRNGLFQVTCFMQKVSVRKEGERV